MTTTAPLSRTEELIPLTCCACAGSYALSKRFHENALRLGGRRQVWHCPYCQAELGFSDSDYGRLKKQVDSLEQQNISLRSDREWHRVRADRIERSKSAIKGQLTKERKRIANGVCPCCNRTFTDLWRHMASKHPDHATKPVEPPSATI